MHCSYGVIFFSFQILVVSTKLGDFSVAQYEVYCQLVVPAILVHSDLCSTWHAALWWRVCICYTVNNDNSNINFNEPSNLN